MDTKAFGLLAEGVAARNLNRLGYRILERNVRFSRGELDLVAKHGEILVFCEVKARRGPLCGEPGEAIDARKQARLARLAVEYLRIHPELSGCPCRFDAVLLWREGWRWRTEVIADAFRPGWE
ncbi:MAG: YraN family protein [Magnetococcales bacterium]|nr:YraN family protein [Magnetococcales bacterium]